MPTLEADFLDPLWIACRSYLPEVIDTHPFGGHRPRVSNRVVFERLLEVVINGLSYRRAGTSQCSATTIRRRRDEWIEAGVFEKLLQEIQDAFHKIIGFDLSDISVDGTHTVSPRGGEVSGPSPVNRGKLGTKLSIAVDAFGVPLGVVVAAGNRHDSPLLAPTLERVFHHHADQIPEKVCVHLDAGYDSFSTRSILDELGFDYDISKKGTPLQTGKRWVVERTNAWFREYNGLSTCNERKLKVVETWVQFVISIILVKKLVKYGFSHYRWEGRPQKWKSCWGRSPSERLNRWMQKKKYQRWSKTPKA